MGHSSKFFLRIYSKNKQTLELVLKDLLRQKKTSVFEKIDPMVLLFGLSGGRQNIIEAINETYDQLVDSMEIIEDEDMQRFYYICVKDRDIGGWQYDAYFHNFYEKFKIALNKNNKQESQLYYSFRVCPEDKCEMIFRSNDTKFFSDFCRDNEGYTDDSDSDSDSSSSSSSSSSGGAFVKKMRENINDVGERNDIGSSDSESEITNSARDGQQKNRSVDVEQIRVQEKSNAPEAIRKSTRNRKPPNRLKF